MTPQERAAMMRQAAELLTQVADDILQGSQLDRAAFASWLSGRSSALVQAACTLTCSAAFCAEQYAKEAADAELREAVR